MTTKKGHAIHPDSAELQDLSRTQKMSTKPQTLVYPDPSKLYFLFTDVSQYCWGATFCQYTSRSNGVDSLKPITFISSKYLDTLCSYVALVSDHKPLEEFLKGKTANSKVNN